jgi:hypothetical protein
MLRPSAARSTGYGRWKVGGRGHGKWTAKRRILEIRVPGVGHESWTAVGVAAVRRLALPPLVGWCQVNAVVQLPLAPSHVLA